ncbi:MAG: flagellar basal body P-ring protein FlgI [Gemmatimonadaceae bacterium]|nr:flagellar basal body P-ring protein FlgI [Gemmatimonadaceae bacterium]
MIVPMLTLRSAHAQFVAQQATARRRAAREAPLATPTVVTLSTRQLRWVLRALVATALAAFLAPTITHAQAPAAGDVRIRDLTTSEGATPIRLMGYGLVVGLDGTGDRAIGGQTAGQTVQSVVNLLRRFDIEVPPELMRMRNVAAALVTAEISPYLRPGGRFEIHVSSMGDARSLRGGVLYMTPLVAEPGGPAMATAQGSLLVSEGGSAQQMRYAPTIETTARIPQGGLLEQDMPRAAFASSNRLLLREPDIGTASRIAAAINQSIGANSAVVEDPGSVRLALADSADRAVTLTRIRELAVRPERAPRVVIDGRDGTVVAGGDVSVGPAVVSHGAVTLAIGEDAANAAPTTQGPAAVRVAVGSSVQRIASALHAVQTPPQEIAAIFAALREVGAITADVVVR